MNMDESVEAVLSERIRECVARKRLPDGFGARLSASVRRARRRLRLRITGIVVLAVIICGIVVAAVTAAPVPRGRGTALVARSDGTAGESSVTNFVLWGILHECFRRTRNSKRKEEEQ